MEDEDRYTRITLRIPKTLHALIAKASESTSKSQNAEIVARLQASFGDDHLGMELGSIGDKLTAAKQELEKAQKKLDDSATNIADKMLDRMHERGLVFKKGIVDGASITSTILGE